MPLKIDSIALKLLDRALGLAGAPQQQTFLEDGSVVQAIDIARLASRARAPGQGWFANLSENAHGAGASNLSTTIDPYAPITTITRSAFPQTIPADLDVWLHWAGVVLVGTAANFTEGSLLIAPGLTNTGDLTGAGGPTAILSLPIARWDAVGNSAMATLTGINSWEGSGGGGQSGVRLGIRLARGSTLLWQSRAGGAIDANLVYVTSLNPTGLPSDVLT